MAGLSDITVWISYLGPDRPGLISHIIGYLNGEKGAFYDITFAALGRRGAEFTLIYRLPQGLDQETIQNNLDKLEAVSQGDLKVRPFDFQADKGPTSRITHRFILSGAASMGYLAKALEVFDAHGAIIVRMNTERLQGRNGDTYTARFALSLREERVPNCMSGVAQLCGDHKLSFRYETS